jgi:hypothetical protein
MTVSGFNKTHYMHTKGPYTEEAPNAIYALLFADDLQAFLQGKEAPEAYPWPTLFDAGAGDSDLLAVARDTTLESRLRLLAYHRLRSAGQPIEEKELLGVVVEVGMDDGLDALATYREGTARYINYTGSMIIWESPDQVSLEIAAQLFNESMNIVRQIGPWNNPRKPWPGKGVVRISFLVSDGLYFGEGPINVLFNDAMGGPALRSATAMMQYLTSKASGKAK